MLSYILFGVLLLVVAVGVVRASKQPRVNRKKKLRVARGSLIAEKKRVPQAKPIAAARTVKYEPEEIADLDEDLQDDAYDDDFVEDPIVEEPRRVVQPARVQQSKSQPKPKLQPQAQQLKPQPQQIQEPEQELEPELEKEAPPKVVKRPVENEIITITLRAEDNRPYKGYELLQALLTSGMRYSRQGVFHRYTKLIRRDEILFSLISGVAPGIFDLPKMGTFSSPALTLFMQTGELEDPEQTYNMMIATAQELIEGLGGKLLDEKKAPLTEEKVLFWQNRLRGTLVS